MNRINYFIVLLLGLFSFQAIACDCDCVKDCSFSSVATGGFVAMVKVLEYSEFMEFEDNEESKKMPLAMKVEVVKKYKGEETRNIIQIWGDNGMLCRPYTSNFQIGKYYLIAPKKIVVDSEDGKINDYYFFACETNFLSVDFEKRIVYGDYAKNVNKIALDKVEKDLLNKTKDKGIKIKN